jgi:glycosyltransferase involved in cell wall biosynthesis
MVKTNPHLPPVLLAGNFLSAVGGSRSVLEDLGDRLEAEGCSLVAVSRRRNGIVRGMDLVLNALWQRRRYRVAIVDLYSGKAFLWGEALSILLARLGCPFILVLRGGALPEFSRRWPARVHACLARAAAVTVPSPYLLEQMRPYRNDLILLPNPLDLAAYRFTPRREAAPRLLWLRAFEELYNPALAAEVLGRLAKEFPASRLTMVGSNRRDGSWERTEDRARAFGVSDRLALPGGVKKSEVPVWLNRGDIFLNTTHVDNTPVSVLEAMASGLCVVSTNTGGIPYLLEHEVDALLVPCDDADAMAAAVRRILTEPGLAERLSRNGRRKAERFDWPHIFASWKDLLITTAGGRARRHAA